MAKPAPNLENIDYTKELRACKLRTVERMKAILRVLEAPIDVLVVHGIDDAALDMLLDELQDQVSSIEMSVEFHKLGGLEAILNILKHFPDPHFRGSASNVVATLLWDNPQSRRLFMEAKGFEALFSIFSSDMDTDIRKHALEAIFSLIRNNKPAITSFHLANGYAVLRDALTSKNVGFQRQALDLVYLILQEDCEESKIMHELRYVPIMIGLAYTEDAKVGIATLWGLLKLACIMKKDRNNKNNNNNYYYYDYDVDFGAIKKLLQDYIQVINSLEDDEELNRAREHRVLVGTLWRTCFNEPSCLGETGLLEDVIWPYREREPFASPYRYFSVETAFSYYSSSEDSEDSTERWPAN